MKRRIFLGALGVMSLPVIWASTRKSLTPQQAEGPFYPSGNIPENSNLILNNENIMGEEMQLTGAVSDTFGRPLSNARVEIWQCDAQGIYNHQRQPGNEQFDPSFSGAGSCLTDDSGKFRFDTIYPYPYPGRPPHIHVKIWSQGKERLTTQLYLPVKSVEHFDTKPRLRLSVEKIDEKRWTSRFDFVV
ncbi:hypothetical protein [Veronia pacifica]|uniref:Intradiol ring-cleavage dioxygenases domain-containing protein n=1 Tax=Veronia pacifica TaxID=1080227 RepID=A0A1C3EPH9_9GAMM|nr:hypothetical protein [Veronia pacifica]ODA35123.1 hypothetical protein A8L45_05445 [Veronia pacifica]